MIIIIIVIAVIILFLQIGGKGLWLLSLWLCNKMVLAVPGFTVSFLCYVMVAASYYVANHYQQSELAAARSMEHIVPRDFFTFFT